MKNAYEIYSRYIIITLLPAFVFVLFGELWISKNVVLWISACIALTYLPYIIIHQFKRKGRFE